MFEITGVVPPNLVAKLLNACASDSYDKLDDVVQDIIREGYRYAVTEVALMLTSRCSVILNSKLNFSRLQFIPDLFLSAGQVLIHLHDHVVVSDEMSDKQKSVILESVAASDKCLADGADEYLQLMSAASLRKRTSASPKIG